MVYSSPSRIYLKNIPLFLRIYFGAIPTSEYTQNILRIYVTHPSMVEYTEYDSEYTEYRYILKNIPRIYLDKYTNPGNILPKTRKKPNAPGGM